MTKYSMHSTYPKFKNVKVTNSATIDNDLTVSDDLTVTDDAAVGGTLTASGLTLGQASKSSAYTITGDDAIIGVDTSSAAVTVTLASALVAAGRVVIVHDEGGAAGTNAVTIATEGSETIDGSASASISANYGTTRLYSDGTNWFTF